MRKDRDDRERKRGYSLIGKILMVIGLLTVIYLFITEVLMRVLAALTVS